VENQVDEVGMLRAFDTLHTYFEMAFHSSKLAAQPHHMEWPHPKDEVHYRGWESCRRCEQTYGQALHGQEYDHLHQKVSSLQHQLHPGFVTRANVYAKVFRVEHNKSYSLSLPDFEGVAEFGNTSSCGIEKVVCFWSNTDMLRHIQYQWGKTVEMAHTQVWTVEFLFAKKHKQKCPAFLRFRVKPYILFAGFAATKFFRKRSVTKGNECMLSNINPQLTEVVFRSVFIFLVSHQFLHSAGRGLHMIDNQLIQIGVHVRGVNNKLTPHILTSGISIAFSDI
jgi:hypothetical protein